MRPVTRQYSGIASTARSTVRVCGEAGMSSAAATVAPDDGRPIDAAGTANPARESHATRLRTGPF